MPSSFIPPSDLSRPEMRSAAVEGDKKRGKKGPSIRDPQRIVGPLQAFHSSGSPSLKHAIRDSSASELLSLLIPSSREVLEIKPKSRIVRVSTTLR